MRHSLFFLTLLLLPYLGYSQLVVNNGFTAQQLGNNLAGSNVVVTNASITGTAVQSGIFQYTGTDLGLNSGVILSTGSVFDAVGPNLTGGTSTDVGGPGDADLSALAGFPTNDAVVFEFDFEVQGDEIEFSFVFLSEEYNEYVNTGFNDVFAFYISGPGITGQENLAIVPSTTTPVTINSINNGSFWQYYFDNDAGIVNVEFDGFTTLMKAMKSGLIPCETYTLSLRIADGSDAIFDSAVLLEENSLVQTNVSASSSTFSSNNTALEGCIDASFTFALDSLMDTDVEIGIGIGGSATNGIDYSQIDSLLIIPAGQLSATLIIDAIADGLTEGIEVVELYFLTSPCAPPDTVFLYIDDYQPLEYTTTPSDLSCFESGDGQVDFNITGGTVPYTVTLTDSATGLSADYTSFPVVGLGAGTYYIEVIDGYGCVAEDLVSGAYFDAGQTFIPDGMGGSYSSTLMLSGFSAGQTITSPTQIQSVCATMEHSRIGELEILLTAPDGTVVVLKEQPGGAITNFGEPCAVGPADAGNTDTLPGIGYNYCWTATATYGTMVSESNTYTYSYTNQCDGSTQTDKYLPSGAYLPYQSFSNFIGAPLNGGWQITVTDAIPNNNGYIFDWSISLEADPPDSIVTLIQPDLPLFNSTVVNPDCGLSNGAIDITVSGGIAPYTYLWSNGATTEDISGLTSGSYTVNVTDDSACVYPFQVDLSNNGSIVLSGITTDETCVGSNDGTINLTVTGATAPIIYSWSNGATTEDLLSVVPGTYTVNVSDATGCLGITSFTINSANSIAVSGTVTNENCGDMEGFVTPSVLGGVQPYSYLWSNGDTNQIATELEQGNYTITVTDANGCSEQAAFSVINLVGNCIPNCDLGITNSIVQDEICGNVNGFVDITVFTSNGPVQINWDNGAITEDLNTLSSGVYEVMLTDNVGCEIIQSFTIVNQTGGLTISGINVGTEFCGNGQGSLDVSVSGGAQPYQYSWSNGAVTEDLSGLSSGDYALTVTDANGCSYSDLATVTNNSGTLEQIYGNAVDEVCTQNNGSIDIIIQGGQLPYSYNWSNGAISEDLINIPAGSYTCTIIDGNGCSITTPTYVVNNDAGTLSFDLIDVDNEICSNNLGEIELFFTGGTLPFTYAWNTGASTQNLFGISAGTYTAVITDAGGCQLSTGDLLVVNESGTLNLDNIVTFNETCSNGIGMVNITVSGGTNPISYLWSNGSTSEDISNLSAGNYNCIITDSNGCEINVSASVANDPGVLNIDNIVVSNENCGQNDGSLNLIISGETMPVTYTWSNGAITEDLSSVFAGIYNVEILDANGCVVTGSATVINNSGTLSLDAEQLVNEICSGANGSIDITVTGGVAPLTYLWSNGASTEDLSGISAGVYSCEITDDLGCSISAGSYTINNSTVGFQVSLNTLTDEICSNSLGAIDVTIVGGISPYVISWSSGQTSEDISNIAAGSYSIVVTDASGCMTTHTYTVSNNSGTLTLNSVLVTDEVCTDGNGAIDITVSGGTLPYVYNWSSGQATEDISGLSQNSYTVAISDALGCLLTSAAIIVNDISGSMSLDGLNVSNETCGDGTGNIDIIVSGGTGSISYLWSDGSVNEDLAGVNSGAYSGTATDANGCELSFSATVQNDPGNMVVAGAIVNTTCGLVNGSIDLTVTGATLPLNFVWSNGAVVEDIINVLSGTYICNVLDASGCSYNYSGTINDIGGVFQIDNVIVTNETCGNGLGAISVNPTGGMAPFNYSWCCGLPNSNEVVGLSAGTFNVSVTDVNGCVNNAAIVVNNSSGILSVSNPVIVDETCGDSNGSIDVTITGTPPITILWSNAATSEDIANLSAGNYTVTVSDVNGCSATEVFAIVNNSGGISLSAPTIMDDNCGNAVGSIDITIAGGVAPITYNWNNGATTEDISGLVMGTYTVSITDGTGCTFSQSYTVGNISPGITVTAVVNDEQCGQPNGGIDVTLVGATSPITYNWSNGATTEDLFNVNAGIYSVTILDGTGCSLSYEDTIISAPSTLMINSATVSNEFCTDGTGSIFINTTGGTSPYVYLWNTGATTQNLSNLSAGTYNVTVTDAMGCQVFGSYVVGNDATFQIINANVVDETCSDGFGFIDLTVNGFGLSYSWSNGATTQDIFGLSAGTYTVTISSGPLCTITQTYTVLNGSGTLVINNVVVTDDNCGQGTGALDLFVSGGGFPYFYNWSNGAITQDLNGLTAGNYNVTVTDNSGCSTSYSTVVNNNTFGLSVSNFIIADDNCGNSLGSIDITIVGGVAPYSFLWGNGAVTEDLNGLSIGTYSVSVTDINGCSFSQDFIVSGVNNNLLGAIITGSDTCANGVGSLNLTVSGGTSPYVYSWSNGATTEDLNGVTTGVYSVTITDNLGCNSSVTDSVLNTEIPVDLISSTLTNPTCSTCQDGAIEVFVGGISAPYYFDWSPLFEASDNLTALTVGDYPLVITNVYGCTLDTLFTLESEQDIIGAGEYNFDVYPNPSNGIFYIEMTSGEYGVFTYEVFDVIGKLVKIEEVAFSFNQSIVEIDLQKLAGATYSINLYNETFVFPLRIVLTKE